MFLLKHKLSEDEKFISVNKSQVFIQFSHKNNLLSEKIFVWSKNDHSQWTRPDPTRPTTLWCSTVTSADFLLCSWRLTGFMCGSAVDLCPDQLVSQMMFYNIITNISNNQQ